MGGGGEEWRGRGRGGGVGGVEEEEGRGWGREEGEGESGGRVRERSSVILNADLATESRILEVMLKDAVHTTSARHCLALLREAGSPDPRLETFFESNSRRQATFVVCHCALPDEIVFGVLRVRARGAEGFGSSKSERISHGQSEIT